MEENKLPEEGQPILKFKGKFQEAAPRKCCGRIYPWPILEENIDRLVEESTKPDDPSSPGTTDENRA